MLFGSLRTGPDRSFDLREPAAAHTARTRRCVHPRDWWGWPVGKHLESMCQPSFRRYSPVSRNPTAANGVTRATSCPEHLGCQYSNVSRPFVQRAALARPDPGPDEFLIRG